MVNKVSLETLWVKCFLNFHKVYLNKLLANFFIFNLQGMSESNWEKRYIIFKEN